MIIRLTNYIQKLFCCANSPSNLANCFIINSDLNKIYNLRNLFELKIPDKGNFIYFFSKFINKVINDLTHYRFNYYKKCVKNNINLLHDRTVCTFPKFDLNFKIYYSKKQKKSSI